MKGAMVILALLCAGCSDSISVPVAACQRAYTGRTDTIVTYQCASYDSKGQCNVSVPVFTEYKQVRYDCAFTRME